MAGEDVDVVFGVHELPCQFVEADYGSRIDSGKAVDGAVATCGEDGEELLAEAGEDEEVGEGKVGELRVDCYVAVRELAADDVGVSGQGAVCEDGERDVVGDGGIVVTVVDVSLRGLEGKRRSSHQERDR